MFSDPQNEPVAQASCLPEENTGWQRALQPRGSALIIAMSVILLLAGLSAALVSTIQTRSLRVQVDLEDLKAFEAAEAGIDAALDDINRAQAVQIMLPAATHANPSPTGQTAQFSPDSRPMCEHEWSTAMKGSVFKNSPGCLGTEYWRPALDDNMVPVPRPANYVPRPRWPSPPVINGQNVPVQNNITPVQMGDVFFFTYTVAWLHDGIDNNGDGAIDDITERNKYTIYSTGVHKGLSRTGVTTEGKVVTVEVVTEALDMDSIPLPNAGLEMQVPPNPAPPIPPGP